MEGTNPERFNFSCHRLKNYLWDTVDDKLQLAGPKLRERDNAAELSIFLGMPEDIINIQYKAMSHFEKTMKVRCPHDDVSSIEFLIEIIDIPNGVLEQSDAHSFHLHEQIRSNKIIEDLNAVRNVIANAGYNYLNLCMHGTRASVLRKVRDAGGVLGASRSTHDFGPGTYCFRNDFLAALTFAFERSYPTDNLGMILYVGPHASLQPKLVDVNTNVLAGAPPGNHPDYAHFNAIVGNFQNDKFATNLEDQCSGGSFLGRNVSYASN